jgi:hypothetical protein
VELQVETALSKEPCQRDEGNRDENQFEQRFEEALQRIHKGIAKAA